MNILKDSFYLTLSKGIRSIVMMVVVMIMTRLTSMEIYGTYRQLITLSTMILAIAPLGIPISVSYYYKNLNINQRNKLISNTFLICAICGIISSAIFIIFKAQISGSLNITKINNYILGFSLYNFILVLSSFIENLFVSAGLTKSFSICNIIYYIAFILVIIAFIYKDSELRFIFIVMFVMELIKFLVLLTVAIKKLQVSLALDFRFMKEQIIYCIPLGLIVIMQALNNLMDKLVVSGYFTTSEFAIYSTGTMEIPIVNLITISLATAALPHMSKEYNSNNNIREVLNIWGNITIAGAAVLFPIFFILGFYNRAYIQFLFSEKYLSCIPFFMINLLRLPLSCTVFGNILIIMGKQKVTVFNMIISIVVNIACNILLIPLLGMAGATISGLIMHVTIIYLQLYQISKYTGIRIKNLMPYSSLIKILGVSFVVIFVVYLLSSFFSINHIVKFFVFGSLAFVINIYTLMKLKLIYFNVSEKISSLKNKTLAPNLNIARKD